MGAKRKGMRALACGLALGLACCGLAVAGDGEREAATAVHQAGEPAQAAQHWLAQARRTDAPADHAWVIEAMLEAGHLLRARAHFAQVGARLPPSVQRWLAGLLSWRGGDEAEARAHWAGLEAGPWAAQAGLLQAEAAAMRGEAARAQAMLAGLVARESLPPLWALRASLVDLATAVPPPAPARFLAVGEALAGLPASHRRAVLGLALAESMLRQPERAGLQAAGQAELDRALAVAEAAGSLRARAQVLAALSTHGTPEEARLPRLREAIRLAEAAAADELAFRLHWQLARSLAGTAGDEGERLASLAAYGRAVDALERVRADVVSALPAGLSYRETLGPLYVAYADALLREAGQRDETAALPLLQQAQTVLERLKQAELQDYFQDDCVNRQLAAGAGLASPPEGSAVLYTVMLPDRLALLLNVGGRLRQQVVAVTQATLTAEGAALRELLEKRSTREFAAASRRLHGWLIAPILPWLEAAGTRALVVVPDGVLRTLPFAALRDDKAYLIERFALAVSPAMSLTDLAPLAPERGQGTLVGGLSVAVQGFPALPAVADELGVVREAFGGRLLHNESFLLDDLARSLRETPYRVVHLASHGEFGARARDTFVLTYDQRLDMDGLERLIAGEGGRREPVELLTLSACQTASGDERAALGLAGVAMKAGARSALATLWAVNDRASAELVSRFYRALAEPGLGRAGALQRAQRELIASARFNHPAYWAPFILIGNWL